MQANLEEDMETLGLFADTDENFDNKSLYCDKPIRMTRA